MVTVNNKDIPEDFNMFSDLWNLYKKYYYPENNDQYWLTVRNDFLNLAKKYKSRLSEDLSLAIINELERKSKE